MVDNWFWSPLIIWFSINTIQPTNDTKTRLDKITDILTSHFTSSNLMKLLLLLLLCFCWDLSLCCISIRVISRPSRPRDGRATGEIRTGRRYAPDWSSARPSDDSRRTGPPFPAWCLHTRLQKNLISGCRKIYAINKSTSLIKTRFNHARMPNHD